MEGWRGRQGGEHRLRVGGRVGMMKGAERRDRKWPTCVGGEAVS